MLTKQAIEFFKTQKGLAEALTKAGHKISQPSIALWKNYPPDVRQLQIERITDGALKAEPECRARVLGLPLQRSGDRKGKR
jgi:hypothetical protein